MLYDAFLFLNELEILEIRLHTLYRHVDKFVLVEANQTFSTLSSKGTFLFEENKHLFKDFLDKIIHIKLENEFLTTESLKELPWPQRLKCRLKRTELANQNETHHRNSIVRGLCAAEPHDLVLISDIDEIINPECLPEAVERLKTEPVVGFEQQLYRYFLNIHEKDSSWTAPRLTTCENAFRTKPHTIRGQKVPLIRNGGWHFTCIGNMEKLLYKSQSFLHHDRCYRGEYKDVHNLEILFRERVIKKGIDIFDFIDCRYEIVEIDETFPEIIHGNQDRYRELIFSPEPPPGF
ncbi:MAG: hypothetical protein AAGU11_01685 [Syntrophobacteraceae bacterium]